MIPFALLPAVLAGGVYINGVRADLLPEVTLSNATVRFDAQGDVWIDAPGYHVQVLSPGEPAVPVRTPAPSVSSAQAASMSDTGSRTTPVATWWLVTEDDGSTGHTLEVLVNGTLVRRVASGQPQLILDVGAYLRRGANTVVVQGVPGGSPAGGPLSIYLGRGNTLSGTLRLDNPEVAFSARASDGAGGSPTRQYTLTVP
jgi:hypothetical protein